MKIVLTEGCICDSLMIDDKGAREYSNDELKDIIKKILTLEKSKFNLIKLLGQVVEIFDDEWYTDNIKVNTVKYGLIELESFDIDVPNRTLLLMEIILLILPKMRLETQLSILLASTTIMQI